LIKNKLINDENWTILIFHPDLTLIYQNISTPSCLLSVHNNF